MAEEPYPVSIEREVLDEMSWDVDALKVRSFISAVKRSGIEDFEESIRNFFDNQRGKVEKMLLHKRKDMGSIEELEKMLAKGNYSVLQMLIDAL